MSAGARGHRPTTIVVTGGAGFIGSNFIRWLLDREPEVRVINLDLLTYAGNLESLEDVQERHGPSGDDRYRFVHGDICDRALVQSLISGVHPAGEGWPTVDGVAHLAAESHVDRSIHGPDAFARTNVIGTLSLLEATRRRLDETGDAFRFLHVSTDEVYGTLTDDDPAFTEATPLAPNSPYSATKAGSDLLVRSYCETYGFPAVTTRCSNNYGPYQFPEKLVPLMITRALADEPLPVYGDGSNRRDWIHVEDHAAAIWRVMSEGRDGGVYNAGGQAEIANIDVVKMLLDLLDKPHTLIRFVTDRPGHDFRYAVDISKIGAELDWAPAVGVEEGMRSTVQWYVENRTWWERVLSEAYRTANDHYLTTVAGSDG